VHRIRRPASICTAPRCTTGPRDTPSHPNLRRPRADTSGWREVTCSGKRPLPPKPQV
jgi:hypothetical protein